MEEVVPLCLVTICVLVPLAMATLGVVIYFMGVGSLKIPGIARGEHREGKDWLSLPEFSQKTAETFGAVVSAIGALFGLVGFLLPWVQLNIGGGAGALDLGGLTGTLTGIAFMVQSFIVGVGLFGVEVEGAALLGTILVASALFVALIPLTLVILTALGAGMVASPLGVLKVNVRRLSKPLLLLSVLGLCISCGFLAAIQGTVGGLEIGGAESIFGTSFTFGIKVDSGFWVTVGGLVLAVIGAINVRSISSRLGEMTSKLANLRDDEYQSRQK